MNAMRSLTYNCTRIDTVKGSMTVHAMPQYYQEIMEWLKILPVKLKYTGSGLSNIAGQILLLLTKHCRMREYLTGENKIRATWKIWLFLRRMWYENKWFRMGSCASPQQSCTRSKSGISTTLFSVPSIKDCEWTKKHDQGIFGVTFWEISVWKLCCERKASTNGVQTEGVRRNFRMPDRGYHSLP